MLNIIVEFFGHEEVQSELKKLAGIFKGLRLKEGLHRDIVTYNEVVEYFVKSRPENNRIAKGALMMQKNSEGKKLTFLFLDVNNEPVLDNSNLPYGKTIIANSVDEALVEFSEGHSIIIFE